MSLAPFVVSFGTCITGVVIFFIGIATFFATIFELDIDRYKDWTFQQLYYGLYPYIQDDFMGKKDCGNVHGAQNMTAGTYTVTHGAFQGGNDLIASAQKAIYKGRFESGEITLNVARETGRFTG